MEVVIDMCEYYEVSDPPELKPKCKRGNRASLKCHSKREDCPHYTPSMVYKGGKRMNEELREFWEWCGLVEEVDGEYHMWYKDGSLVCSGYQYRIPEPNLDNLFKYAVPKAIKKYQRTWSDGTTLPVKLKISFIWCYGTPYKREHWVCLLSEPSGTYQEDDIDYEGSGNDHAQALYQALNKLRRDEK